MKKLLRKFLENGARYTGETVGESVGLGKLLKQIIDGIVFPICMVSYGVWHHAISRLYGMFCGWLNHTLNRIQIKL